MFKNLVLYRLGAESLLQNTSTLEAAIQPAIFQPCGPTEQASMGFVPPRGLAHAPLIEVVDSNLHLRIRTEKRVLPGQAVTRRVEELAATIEEQTGRKPGKKALKDLKEQAVQDLLPQALTVSSDVKIWISAKLKLLAIDAGSTTAAEPIVSALVKLWEGLTVHLIQSAESPAACMAAWLMDGVPPEGFTIDRECELKSEDEMKSVVRYARHALDTEEVRQHLTAGKRPTKLAMSYKDRISFVLTDTLQLKKISFLDLVFEGRDKPGKDEQFDADAAIATGEMGDLIPALIDGLGGEHDFLGSAPSSGASTADTIPSDVTHHDSEMAL